MTTIPIRAARASDLDAVAQLFNAYRQFYQQPDDLGLATGFIAERLNQQDSAILLAVDPSGTVLGFTQIYPSHCSVLAAADYAKGHGMHRLDLTTASTTTAAQSLYESLQWQRDTVFLTYKLSLPPTTP
jgi:ribosomal protein S18 acetylase RimI-like enzyme